MLHGKDAAGEMAGMSSHSPSQSSAARGPLIAEYLGKPSIPPLRRLDAVTSQRLQASIAITSHGQAVEELVLNAVDAHATKISIHLDVSRGDIVVEDNGQGVTPACMPQIGMPWSTSKCAGLRDLLSRSQARTFGFRGQALAALTNVSSLRIITRERGSALSWSKEFSGGKVLHCQPLVTVKNSKLRFENSMVKHYGISAYGDKGGGTTVIVSDLFFNQAVRRRRMNPKSEIYNVVTRLRRIAFSLPDIEFELIDEATSKLLFKRLRHFSTSSTGLLSKGWMQRSFESCFGRCHDWDFVELRNTKPSRIIMKPDGQPVCISVDVLCSRADSGARSKDLQFLYVNRRYVKSNKINKIMNDLMSSTVFVGSNESSGRAGTLKRAKSLRDGHLSRATSAIKVYPVFVIMLSMSAESYNVLGDPDKTNVEFTEWDIVTELICSTMQAYLKACVVDSNASTQNISNDSPRQQSLKQSYPSVQKPNPPQLKRALSRPSSKSFPFSLGGNKRRKSALLMLKEHGEKQIQNPVRGVQQFDTNSYKSYISPSSLRQDLLAGRTSFPQNERANENDEVMENGVGNGEGVKLCADVLRGAVFIGQLASKFILMKCQNGTLLCFDQHAADERVQLENIELEFREARKRSSSEDHGLKTYTLPRPLSLHLLPDEEDRVTRFTSELESWGFHVYIGVPPDEGNSLQEGIGNGSNIHTGAQMLLASAGISKVHDTYKNEKTGQKMLIIRKVPMLFNIPLTARDMRQFLQELNDRGAQSNLHFRPSFVTRILNSLACRRAIKFGLSLSSDECIRLVHNLSKCSLPFQCAHGRPSVVPLATGSISNCLGLRWSRTLERRRKRKNIEISKTGGSMHQVQSKSSCL